MDFEEDVWEEEESLVWLSWSLALSLGSKEAALDRVRAILGWIFFLGINFG